MGITGLLPLLASVTRSTHLAQFAGLRVAIDAYVWLHRGAYGCSWELCEGIGTHKCVCSLKIDKLLLFLLFLSHYHFPITFSDRIPLIQPSDTLLIA
jgi:hypothetical protein